MPMASAAPTTTAAAAAQPMSHRQPDTGAPSVRDSSRDLVIEANAPGGQAGSSSRIENYLGFPSGLTGADLAKLHYGDGERTIGQVDLAPYAALPAVDAAIVVCEADEKKLPQLQPLCKARPTPPTRRSSRRLSFG